MKHFNILLAGLISISITSCNLFGLDLVKNEDFTPSGKDNSIDMNTLDFIKSREDIFSSMLEAIKYAELESMYLEPGNTYILLTNSALSGTGSTSYFQRNRINGLVPNSWSEYPQNEVRELLLYHIIKGEYSYHNLTDKPLWLETYGEGNFELQKDENTIIKGDTAVMAMCVGKVRELPLLINNFEWNYRGVLSSTQGSCRTTNLKLTNGYAHVTDFYLPRPTKKNLGFE